MTDYAPAFRTAGFDDSMIECVRRAGERGAPLIALGQTVFWDELLKSMVAEAARRYAPGLRLIAGAHDTDYFSKLPHATHSDSGFSLQPRDDDRTSQMWAAVAETSAVLGTEYPVTRAELRSAGLPLHQLADHHPGGPSQFYREATMAWGWRGVANHASGRAVACDISAMQVSPTVRELMEWAVESSSEVLLDEGSRQSARRLLQIVEGLIDLCRSHAGERTLTDLYLCLLGGFYSTLLGEMPEHVDITASTELFLFTADTLDRPRFDAVELFLDTATRDQARAAYDAAVAHSGIYHLEQFGEGAIPFDVVICGRGRGTIRVLGDRVAFELPDASVEGRAGREVTDRAALLEAATDAFAEGEACPRLRLVGKAIALPLMLSREFTMLLLENASVYLPQTHRLVRMLRRRGIDFPLNPILRLHFETWDAARVTHARLRLPEHLAHFFPSRSLSAAEFSSHWRAAVANARALIDRLSEVRAPEEMLQILTGSMEMERDLPETHERIAAQRRDSGKQIQELRERTQTLWQEIKQLLRVADAAHEAPPEERLSQLRQERQELIGRILKLAGSEEHTRLQESYHEIVLEIERRRLQLLADAHRTVGLEQSNYRPPWWWFLAVDPSGAWLRELAEHATMRVEPLGMRV
jgi:hypothetical protein